MFFKKVVVNNTKIIVLRNLLKKNIFLLISQMVILAVKALWNETEKEKYFTSVVCWSPYVTKEVSCMDSSYNTWDYYDHYNVVFLFFCCLFALFCSPRDQAQGLAHVGQELYYWGLSSQYSLLNTKVNLFSLIRNNPYMFSCHLGAFPASIILAKNVRRIKK